MRLGAVARACSVTLASLVLAAISSSAMAQQTVKIGWIYPLSGGTASPGNFGKMAIEVATDIINNAHPELGDLPLAKDAGLPGLGGAKIEVVYADHQGKPDVGANTTLRLITEEKVHALVCCYESGVTLTASAIAEKYGIPFVNPESVAANLTERGFKWFFRVTPVASDFAKLYMDFLKEQKAAGVKVDNIALVHENTEYGTSVTSVISAAAKANGFNIALDVPYGKATTDVQSQVLQLKEKNPDVIIMISYTADAILYVKTMKALDYKPPMMIADNAGFSDPSFIKTVGDITQGVFNRSSFGLGKPDSMIAKVNELYKKKSGVDLDDTTARMMQGFMVMVEAINRAGSTEPAKIQAALKATDLKPNQIIMGYNGVKFDEKGQNILASGLMIQLQGAGYVPVWPKEKATAEIKMPYKGW